MKNRFAPAALALSAIPVLLVGLAACSSAGADATKKDSEGTSSSVKTTGFDWDVAKATCMRDAGHDYQDPSPDGKVQPMIVPGDSDAFAKDDASCTSQVTKKLGERPVSAAEKKESEELLKQQQKTADCLRKAGYEVPESSDGMVTGSRSIPTSAYEKCGVTSNHTVQLDDK